MQSLALLGGSAAVACAIGFLFGQHFTAAYDPKRVHQAYVKRKRELMPNRIILVRHGESEGNADHSLYRTKADNLIELTEQGSKQAVQAGERIAKLIGKHSKVRIFVSPFERTLQTSRNLRIALDTADQVVKTTVDSRIREQEFGNLQGDDFKEQRKRQQQVGRFFFRFSDGESGADVYDRTKQWFESALQVNEDSETHVDTLVVVTHGLTMRFILMQLHNWSVNTFHSVWNAGNCDMYVLKKDLHIKGLHPYQLCAGEGEMPRSSITLHVTTSGGSKQQLVMEDYLSLPEPRTQQLNLVKKRLAEQHGLDPKDVLDVDFCGGKFKKFR